MTTGDRLSKTPAGVRLCAAESLKPGDARGFVLEMRAGRFHGFVVRQGDDVHGYVDSCPHMGMPLAKILDDYRSPSGDFIQCDWHGALFRPDDGECVGGPCVGARLIPWPVEVRGAFLETV